LDRLQLALQLQIALPALGCERALRKGVAYRAARLLVVCAVGEAAAPGDLLDVAERQVEIGVPELQLADPRRVEHDSAQRQQDQLTMARRVTSGVIVFPHLLRV